MEKTKVLRKGFTTGTCAAAGAKAAALCLFAAIAGKPCKKSRFVPVTLPSGDVLKIPVRSVKVRGSRAEATIIKDAGDDPDATHGAEFITEVEFLGLNKSRPGVTVKGGEGVGVVTRPGLKVPPGRPAINPVPVMMIKNAVLEAARACGIKPSVIVIVKVPKGKEIAEKTMNARLGILGGISILGTTGIVEPMSLAAYRHSISLGTDVALAGGCSEVVFSTGRSSEKVVQAGLKLPEIACVLTGDHMGFALNDSKGRAGLERVTVAGQFGKFTKLAAGHFETHCSDSSVEFEFLAGLCREQGARDSILQRILKANTAREVFFILKDEGLDDILKTVCKKVKKNSRKIIGPDIAVRSILVGYNNDIVCAC